MGGNEIYVLLAYIPEVRRLLVRFLYSIKIEFRRERAYNYVPAPPVIRVCQSATGASIVSLVIGWNP